MYDETTRRPRYVTVTAMHYINGMCMPQVVETEKGSFLVEGVAARQDLSSHARNYGATERYKIKIRNVSRYLYRKGERWFMFPQKSDTDIFERDTEDR